MAAGQQPVRAAGRGAGLHQPGVRPVRLSSQAFHFRPCLACDWSGAAVHERSSLCTMCAYHSACPGRVQRTASCHQHLNPLLHVLGLRHSRGSASLSMHTGSGVLNCELQAVRRLRRRKRALALAAAWQQVGPPCSATDCCYCRSAVYRIQLLFPQLHFDAQQVALSWLLGTRRACTQPSTSTGSCTRPTHHSAGCSGTLCSLSS